MRVIKQTTTKEDGRRLTYYWFATQPSETADTDTDSACDCSGTPSDGDQIEQSDS